MSDSKVRSNQIYFDMGPSLVYIIRDFILYIINQNMLSALRVYLFRERYIFAFEYGISCFELLTVRHLLSSHADIYGNIKSTRDNSYFCQSDQSSLRSCAPRDAHNVSATYACSMPYSIY